MKLYNIILSLLLVACFSCESLLEVEPEGNIAGDVFQDAESMQKALTGAYYNLGGIHDGSSGGELFGGDFIIIPTLLAHIGSQGAQEIGWESIDGPNYIVFVNKEPIPSINERVARNWLRAYETLSLVNSILENVKKISESSERDRITGESLAIRGALYFEMVRLYAPQFSENTKNSPALPYLTSPILKISDTKTAALNTVEEVYNLAEQDLLNASVLLEPFGNNGVSLSYYSCQAFLARLYMQKGQYEDAVKATNAILINSKNLYALNPQFMDAFSNSSNSSEDIFAVQQTLSNNAGDRSVGEGLTAYYSSISESGLGTFYVYQTSLFESPDPALQGFFLNNPKFSSGDERAQIDLSITKETPSNSIDVPFYPSLTNEQEGLISSAKYISASHVIPIIRLSEVFLNRAESIYETDNAIIDPTALSDLNIVRQRSGLSTLSQGDFSSPSEFYDSIIVERNREFLHEGHLLHDLRRRSAFRNLGRIGTKLVNIDPLSSDLILPVPQAERDTRD